MNYLNNLQQEVLSNLQFLIEYVEENNLTNEQIFLSFLDKLNKISVMY